MDIEKAQKIADRVPREITFEVFGARPERNFVAVDGMDFTAEELEALLVLLRARGQE